VTYALIRGSGRHAQFVTAPKGLGAPGQIVPPVLAADTDAKRAWLSPDLDTAIERQSLLRMAFGLATEVRAIR
jgi:hypothetical protein